MDTPREISVSPSLAMENNLVASAGLLGFTRENIAKPFANSALIETHNAVTSSINDLTRAAVLQQERSLGPVDTPENVKSLSRALRNIWKSEKLDADLRYRDAFHEQDAYDFQYRIREVIQQMHRRAESSVPTMTYGGGDVTVLRHL